jgi:hypothetical protein
MVARVNHEHPTALKRAAREGAHHLARVHASIAMLFVALAITGCTELQIAEGFSWPFWDKDNAPVVPDRLTALWTDTILNQSGKPGTRGFGGRVMFYGKSGEKPVKVEGTLTVYAFDDSDTGETKTLPSRKFVFPAEQLSEHYSESKLGHSYSFWLPWDHVGGEQRNVSLIARFEPAKGPPIKSEITKHILPGIESQGDGQPAGAVREFTLNTSDPSSLPVKNYRHLFNSPTGQQHAGRPEARGTIEQVSYEQPQHDRPTASSRAAGAGQEQPASMSTVTIDMPASLARQTGMAAAQQPDAGLSAAADYGHAFDNVRDDASAASAGINQQAGNAAQYSQASRTNWQTWEQRKTPQARFGHPVSPARVGPSPRPNAYLQRNRPYPSTSPHHPSPPPQQRETARPTYEGDERAWPQDVPPAGE